MSLSLKIKGIDAIAKATKNLTVELKQEINNEFAKFGFDVQADAKNFAPADEGNLRNSIEVLNKDLSVSIFSRLDYAAYLEFGTRKFAAAYVNNLPADWQTYAATFKGKGNGSGDFFETIRRWVKRKGIEDKYAYIIALNILRNGIKAHPFLYPAFRDNIPIFEKRLKALTKR